MEPKINSKYHGNEYGIIHRFKDMYKYDIAINDEELKLVLEHLNQFSQWGSSETVMIYKNIDFGKVEPILKKATKELEHGEKIDLENLLA